MRQIGVGIIGTGWCGGIRAETCAGHPLVKSLHLAEKRPERLAEVAKTTGAKTATADYRELLQIDEIDAVMISATPEVDALPDGARCAGRRASTCSSRSRSRIELAEADELIALARRNKLKFTIGYSQRFNPKFAYVQQVRARRHDRQAGQRAGEPPHHARPGQEDHRPDQALAGGDGSRRTISISCCGACEPAKPVRVYSQLSVRRDARRDRAPTSRTPSGSR